MSFPVLAFIFLGGIAVPWILAFRYFRKPPRGTAPWRLEFFSDSNRWWLPAILLGAAVVRFFHLTELSLWPLTDEAKNAFYAIRLAQGWDGLKLLYDFSQVPPFYIWLEALVFKWGGVSLSTIWFLPALLSLLTVAAGYGAARVFFSKSFAILLALILAFSFWPIYLGRFAFRGSLLVLWEIAVFWLAAWVETRPSKRGGSFLVGVFVGLGFYVFVSWATACLVVSIWFLGMAGGATRGKSKTIGYLTGVALAFLPLGLACVAQNYGGYIRQVGALPSLGVWLRRFWFDPWDIFFQSRVPANLFAYKSFWGGYLNPLLGSGFFLGCLELSRPSREPRPFVRFLIPAFFIFLLPGLWAGGFEMLRIVPVLPLVLGVAAVGWVSLVFSFRRFSKRWAWILLLGFSMILDGVHLFGVYHSVWTQPKGDWFGSKSVERLRAYGILKNLQSRLGPGYLASGLVPDLYDQSLEAASWEFNAAENPALNSVYPRWAAVLTNVHYQTYFQREFPEGKFIWLAGDMGRPDGGLALEILPWPSSQPKELARILSANQASEEMVPVILDNRDYRPRKPVLEALFSRFGYFRGDRFLSSCFWEKVAENEYGDRNISAQILALEKAVQEGIPTAHLYNELAALYFRMGRLKEARKAYGDAMRFPLNHTSAAAGLRFLEDSEKTGRRPRDEDSATVVE